MMASRGMGAMNPKKMPGKKEITRTDDPNKVAMYKRGGKVKRMDEGGLSVKPTDVTLDKDYKRIAAEFSSGDIPIGDKGKASLNANASLSAAKGEKAKALVDQLQADYKHQLDKNTSVGASLSHAPMGEKRYTLSLNKSWADGGEVWDKPNPKKKHKKLSPEKKAKAKAAAKAAGRPYPSLIDNMRMAK
jgi:hypothetical protein